MQRFFIQYFSPLLRKSQYLHAAGTCSFCTRRFSENHLYFLWTSTRFYSCQNTVAEWYRPSSTTKKGIRHLVEAFVKCSRSHIKHRWIRTVHTFVWTLTFREVSYSKSLSLNSTATKTLLHNRKDLRRQQNKEIIHLVEAFVVRSHTRIPHVQTFVWRLTFATWSLEFPGRLPQSAYPLQCTKL